MRLIYERYLALGSLPALQRDLRDRGITPQTRTLSSGKVVGGIALTNGPLVQILRSRTCLAPTIVQAIIDGRLPRSIAMRDLAELPNDWAG